MRPSSLFLCRCSSMLHAHALCTGAHFEPAPPLYKSTAVQMMCTSRYNYTKNSKIRCYTKESCFNFLLYVLLLCEQCKLADVYLVHYSTLHLKPWMWSLYIHHTAKPTVTTTTTAFINLGFSIYNFTNFICTVTSKGPLVEQILAKNHTIVQFFIKAWNSVQV